MRGLNKAALKRLERALDLDAEPDRREDPGDHGDAVDPESPADTALEIRREPFATEENPTLVAPTEENPTLVAIEAADSDADWLAQFSEESARAPSSPPPVLKSPDPRPVSQSAHPPPVLKSLEPPSVLQSADPPPVARSPLGGRFVDISLDAYRPETDVDYLSLEKEATHAVRHERESPHRFLRGVVTIAVVGGVAGAVIGLISSIPGRNASPAAPISRATPDQIQTPADANAKANAVQPPSSANTRAQNEPAVPAPAAELPASPAESPAPTAGPLPPPTVQDRGTEPSSRAGSRNRPGSAASRQPAADPPPGRKTIATPPINSSRTALPPSGVPNAPPPTGAANAPPPTGAANAPPPTGAANAPPPTGAANTPPQTPAPNAPPPSTPPGGAQGSPVRNQTPPVTTPEVPSPGSTATPPSGSAPNGSARSSPAPASPAPAPPPAEPAKSVSDNSAIYMVLGRYQSAFNDLNARVAKSVWPSVDERMLVRAFDGLERQEVVFDSCQIEVAGVRAIASCRGKSRYVPKIGNKTPRVEPRHWTFRLKNAGDNWLIDSVESR